MVADKGKGKSSQASTGYKSKQGKDLRKGKKKFGPKPRQ